MRQPGWVGTLRFSSLAAMVGMLIPTLVSAADSDESPPAEGVPEIVIMGSSQSPWDHVGASTVIDRQDMTGTLGDLAEALDEQPGLRVTRLGGLGSFSMVSIRGSTADQVLILVDGIPLNAAEGGPVDLSTLPLGPIQTLEIHRGFSPSEVGSSALGGVLQIRTRNIDEDALELEAGGGSFATRSARAFVAGAGESWSVATSVDYLGSGGTFSFRNDQGTLFDTAGNDDEIVVRQNNAFDQVAWMVKGRWELSPQTTVRILNMLTWRDLGIAGLGLHPTEEASLDATRNLLGLRLEARDLMEGRVGLTVTPYATWSETGFSDPLSEIGLGTDAIRDQSTVAGATANLRARDILAQGDLWSDYYSATLEARYERFEPGGEARAGLRMLSSERSRINMVGELGSFIEPLALELRGALRLELLDSYLRDPGNRLSVSDLVSSDARESELTWRAGLVASAIPDTSIKLNVARGARFPSLFELFGNTGAVLGNSALRAERGWSLDMGLAHNLERFVSSGVWSLEVFGFGMWFEDLIEFIQNAQNVSVAQNIDSARILGIEAGTYVDLYRHLRARGSLTWMHTENTGDVASRRGRKLPNRPTWKSYAWLEGYFAPVAQAEMGASLEVEYLAGNYLDSANLVAVSPRVILGAGVYIAWLDGQFRAAVHGRNLTNSRVQDFAGFPLPGINVLGTLEWTPGS